MTVTARRSPARLERYRARRLLVCPPTYFDVVYDINPWMGATLREHAEVDRGRAVEQWRGLVDTYRSLGHVVEVIDPVPGLPDMVFTANAATVIAGKALTARFRHLQRRGEEPFFRDWLLHNDVGTVRAATCVNEGEGDFALVGDLLLAGYGFRTSLAAHREAARFFGTRALSMRLVDPRFYHLDTALCVLGERFVAWYPDAFAAETRDRFARLFPDAIAVPFAEAAVLALNLFCDGHHVVLPEGADTLASELDARGFEVVVLAFSELRKAGGGIKCCTLELRR
jgi:N-dimethylarginine dimethylaminohydrolase